MQACQSHSNQIYIYVVKIKLGENWLEWVIS